MKDGGESFPLFIVVIGGINSKIFAFILHWSFFVDIQRLILAFRTEEHNIVQFISFILIPNPFIITKEEKKSFAIGVSVDKNEQSCMRKKNQYVFIFVGSGIVSFEYKIMTQSTYLFASWRGNKLIKHVEEINCERKSGKASLFLSENVQRNKHLNIYFL